MDALEKFYLGDLARYNYHPIYWWRRLDIINYHMIIYLELNYDIFGCREMIIINYHMIIYLKLSCEIQFHESN